MELCGAHYARYAGRGARPRKVDETFAWRHILRCSLWRKRDKEVRRGGGRGEEVVVTGPSTEFALMLPTAPAAPLGWAREGAEDRVMVVDC